MDGATETSVNQKSGETLNRIRIEQSLEKPSEGHSVEIAADEHGSATTVTENKTNEEDDDEEVEPSVLQALSSEQLARRPSFKKILDDLSSADAALHKSSSDPLSAAAAATLQAHQLQAAIQQASASNPALIPGLFQAATNGSGTPATSSAPSATDSTSQLSMMLPPQQQLQLQSALLNSSGVVQSLAAQTNIPATILSSALLNANMAATLSAASSNNAGISGLPGSNVKLDQTIGSTTVDDSSRKREVRLMKNREAARECRRKKKEYVRCLENRVAVLESQNQALIGELRALKELYLPKSQD